MNLRQFEAGIVGDSVTLIPATNQNLHYDKNRITSSS